MSVRNKLMSLEENIISKPIYSMKKNIKYNIHHLKFISKNVRDKDVKQKINTIIELYATRIISQVQTASNGIMNLITNTTEKKKERVNKKYEELIEKHKDVEPLGKRLRQKTETNRSVIKSVEVGDKSKAKVEVKINIKEHDMKNDNHKNFNFMYSNIEKRLISEVEAVMNIKKTMKIQLVLNVIIFRSVSVDE